MQRCEDILQPNSRKIHLDANPNIRHGFFSSNGYLSVMQKEEYDHALAKFQDLTKMNVDLVNSENSDGAQNCLSRKRKKRTHSITFLFENKRKTG